jgi:hypothetical protein
MLSTLGTLCRGVTVAVCMEECGIVVLNGPSSHKVAISHAATVPPTPRPLYPLSHPVPCRLHRMQNPRPPSISLPPSSRQTRINVTARGQSLQPCKPTFPQRMGRWPLSELPW